MTQNTRLLIQYEGTRYRGWQRQKSGDTIQAKIEDVLSRLAGEPVNLIGASRTDAGVYARAQVANFHTPQALDPVAVMDACLRYLPQDIVVLAAEPVPERFHARYLARSKRYIYRIRNRAAPDVFERRLWYHVPGALDMGAMRQAAARLVGEHDFASFCGARSHSKSTHRRLDRLEVSERDGRIGLVLDAPAFLTGMARALAGTLIEVGQGRIPVDEVARIMECGRRGEAGFTAPAHGLCLEAVRYDPPYDRHPFDVASAFTLGPGSEKLGFFAGHVVERGDIVGPTGETWDAERD